MNTKFMVTSVSQKITNLGYHIRKTYHTVIHIFEMHFGFQTHQKTRISAKRDVCCLLTILAVMKEKMEKWKFQ